MASGRLPGIYRFYIEKPDGTRRQVASADSGYWNCSGLGSADGTQSTTATPEKLNFLPLSNDAGAAGYSIVATVEASGTDGVDISDCVGIIPVNVNGNQETIGIPGGNGLNNGNFVADVSGTDITATANVETTLFKVRAKEGVQSFRLGGGKVFYSVENDTA